MGVRYNAEKRKVGMYYSTPIYAFRCKCHLCDGWFEIRTDPKNTRYVVEYGARQQEIDWDPEENGGFRVHDTTQPDPGSVDPLAALEKTSEALKRLDQIERPRIESLQMVSDHYNNDPYTLSSRARRKFREEKRIEKAIKAKDDEVKRRYGLPENLSLLPEDGQFQEDAREKFRTAREKLTLESGSRNIRPASLSAKAALTASLVRNSSLRSNNNNHGNSRTVRANSSSLGVSIRKL
ncbi:hypothetical protein Clacol_002669 [Clathrus columnatus]|uniref:Coiled-coil domain-containing protein 130 n=1 Tax=Clathrus columnatus TaxID=1419009 RepID=A0AAV5A7A9_9AGAM|nr:hypothetical protein Clacol_002669 [Clathrus columnatus]